MREGVSERQWGYYPTEFANWYIDDWITRLYAPLHIKRIEGWYVNHIQKAHATNERYSVNFTHEAMLFPLIKRDRGVVG